MYVRKEFLLLKKKLRKSEILIYLHGEGCYYNFCVSGLCGAERGNQEHRDWRHMCSFFSASEILWLSKNLYFLSLYDNNIYVVGKKEKEREREQPDYKQDTDKQIQISSTYN